VILSTTRAPAVTNLPAGGLFALCCRYPLAGKPGVPDSIPGLRCRLAAARQPAAPPAGLRSPTLDNPAALAGLELRRSQLTAAPSLDTELQNLWACQTGTPNCPLYAADLRQLAATAQAGPLAARTAPSRQRRSAATGTGSWNRRCPATARPCASQRCAGGGHDPAQRIGKDRASSPNCWTVASRTPGAYGRALEDTLRDGDPAAPRVAATANCRVNGALPSARSRTRSRRRTAQQS